MKHELKRERAGKAEMGSITPTCSCGWRGRTEYAYNDYCHTNVKEQEGDHIRNAHRGELETANATLEQQMMDACAPKNEREWWAFAEIGRLRAEVEALRDANERLNVAVAEAERIVRAYARRNPRHEYKGVIQDPFGAHGWLDRFDAARAAREGRG